MFRQQNAPRLIEENHQFAGTGGVSAGNSQARFAPAFQDEGSGKVEISRFQDGRPAPCHMLDGLPEEWIVERDLKGRAVKIKSTVISGFVRLGRFFTRQEAADYMQNMPVEAA
ncbi:hypothetical protein [Amphritea sp. HPY]|uniref:hypothetical protein n=1 Tax=Amphritea sp. HPY TaxID=3421652 RepID=UPI003D7E02FC